MDGKGILHATHHIRTVTIVPVLSFLVKVACINITGMADILEKRIF